MISAKPRVPEAGNWFRPFASHPVICYLVSCSVGAAGPWLHPQFLFCLPRAQCLKSRSSTESKEFTLAVSFGVKVKSKLLL